MCMMIHKKTGALYPTWKLKDYKSILPHTTKMSYNTLQENGCIGAQVTASNCVCMYVCVPSIRITNYSLCKKWKGQQKLLKNIDTGPQDASYISAHAEGMLM